MKRREMLLATATISLAGVPGLSSADTDAAQTEPVQVSDVTVELGGATVAIGNAVLAYQDGAMGVLVSDSSVTAEGRELTLSEGVVAVGNVDEETYAQIREAGAQSVGERSLSPMLSAINSTNLDPNSPVQAQFGPVTADGQTLADEVTATGTVGGVTPENWAEFGRGEDVELGAAQFDTVTIQRGSVALTAEEVVAEPFSNALSVTSAGGTVETPGRSLAFENLNTTFRPPEEGTEPHRTAFEDVRQSAAEGALTVDAVRAALADSGVTVGNTVEAVRATTYEATVGSITEDGETLIQDSSSTGTLAELMQVVRQNL